MANKEKVRFTKIYRVAFRPAATCFENHPEKVLFGLGLVFSFLVFLSYSAFLEGTIGGVVLFWVGIIACLLVLDLLRQRDNFWAKILTSLMLLMLLTACTYSPLLYLNQSPLRCFYSGQSNLIISFKQILNTSIFMLVLLALSWLLYDLGVIFFESRSIIYKGYDFYEFKSTPQFESRNVSVGAVLHEESPKNQKERLNEREKGEPKKSQEFPPKEFVEAKVTEVSFDEKLRKNFNKRFN